MKNLKLFFKDGKLPNMMRLAMQFSAFCMGCLLFLFQDKLSDLQFYTLGFCALVVGKFAYWSGLSELFGYKPFTNDPLGWRKAKESYKENEAVEVMDQLEGASTEDLKK